MQREIKLHIYIFALNLQVYAYICLYIPVFACVQRCGKSNANLLNSKDIFAMVAILVYKFATYLQPLVNLVRI